MTVTYTTEDFIRRAVDRVLRGRYRGHAVCSSCLVGMVLERLHVGWRRSEVELAMGKRFKAAAGDLGGMPTEPCARGQRSTPCLESRRLAAP